MEKRGTNIFHWIEQMERAGLKTPASGDLGLFHFQVQLALQTDAQASVLSKLILLSVPLPPRFAGH